MQENNVSAMHSASPLKPFEKLLQPPLWKCPANDLKRKASALPENGLAKIRKRAQSFSRQEDIINLISDDEDDGGDIPESCPVLPDKRLKTGFYRDASGKYWPCGQGQGLDRDRARQLWDTDTQSQHQQVLGVNSSTRSNQNYIKDDSDDETIEDAIARTNFTTKMVAEQEKSIEEVKRAEENAMTQQVNNLINSFLERVRERKAEQQQRMIKISTSTAAQEAYAIEKRNMSEMKAFQFTTAEEIPDRLRAKRVAEIAEFKAVAQENAIKKRQEIVAEGKRALEEQEVIENGRRMREKALADRDAAEKQYLAEGKSRADRDAAEMQLLTDVKSLADRNTVEEQRLSEEKSVAKLRDCEWRVNGEQLDDSKLHGGPCTEEQGENRDLVGKATVEEHVKSPEREPKPEEQTTVEEPQSVEEVVQEDRKMFGGKQAAKQISLRQAEQGYVQKAQEAMEQKASGQENQICGGNEDVNVEDSAQEVNVEHDVATEQLMLHLEAIRKEKLGKQIIAAKLDELDSLHARQMTPKALRGPRVRTTSEQFVESKRRAARKCNLKQWAEKQETENTRDIAIGGALADRRHSASALGGSDHVKAKKRGIKNAKHSVLGAKKCIDGTEESSRSESKNHKSGHGFSSCASLYEGRAVERGKPLDEGQEQSSAERTRENGKNSLYGPLLQEYVDDDQIPRATTGGKYYSPEMWNAIMKVHLLNDTGMLKSEDSGASDDEESDGDDRDDLFWEYQIKRKTWRDDNDLMEADYIICDTSVDLENANKIAGLEILKDRGELKVLPFTEFESRKDELNMITCSGSSPGGSIRVHVDRILRTRNQGIRPSSKKSWLSKNVYLVWEKVILKIGNDETEDDLFDDSLTNMPNSTVHAIHTYRERANKDASDVFLGHLMAPPSQSRAENVRRNEWKQTARQYLEDLERDALAYKQTSKLPDDSGIIHVWVEEHPLTGPFN
ncbi:MAG: hypothetical protein M1827_002591 [Pycnora praestabilis]|nr:MAG: hypothetical protein M1827_002591 [Pycnora praestabilis]